MLRFQKLEEIFVSVLITTVQNQKSLLSKINLFFWGFFLIWISVGFVTALGGVSMPRWMYWADAWTMILATIITYLWMIEIYGVRKTRLTFLIILLASGLIELIGTNTGWPFGFFKYTDRFSAVLHLPFAENGLALIIPFAWAVLCLNAFYVGSQIIHWKNKWLAVILAGLITMLTDLNLESVAWYMRGYDQAYWRWYTDGTFTQIAQAVPARNFIAWFICTVIFLYLCPLKTLPPLKVNHKPLIILLAFNLLFIAHRAHYHFFAIKEIPVQIEFSVE